MTLRVPAFRRLERQRCRSNTVHRCLQKQEALQRARPVKRFGEREVLAGTYCLNQRFCKVETRNGATSGTNRTKLVLFS